MDNRLLAWLKKSAASMACMSRCRACAIVPACHGDCMSRCGACAMMLACHGTCMPWRLRVKVQGACHGVRPSVCRDALCV